MKSSILYQGLFLMAFALYVQAKNAHAPSAFAPQIASVPTSSSGGEPEKFLLPLSLDLLQRELRMIPALRAGVEGLRLGSSSDGVMVSIRSPDLYRRNSDAVESAWLPTLDQLGGPVYSTLDPELELRIRVYGENSREKGVWILQYFENHFQSEKKKDAAVENVSRGGEGEERIELLIRKKTKQIQ